MSPDRLRMAANVRADEKTSSDQAHRVEPSDTQGEVFKVFPYNNNEVYRWH